MYDDYSEIRKRKNAMREEIAKTIKSHPELSYSEIADDFGTSASNVQRIAAEYNVQRNPRRY